MVPKHVSEERKRGLLRLFILRTVSREPKSGYDILREIEEKTMGQWCPSKGTIYPIISELERDGLIESVEEGARARRAFRTTEKGRNHLEEFVKKHGQVQRWRLDGRRLLFVETFFDEADRKILRLTYDIRREALSARDKKAATKILQEGLRSIKELR